MKRRNELRSGEWSGCERLGWVLECSAELPYCSASIVLHTALQYRTEIHHVVLRVVVTSAHLARIN